MPEASATSGPGSTQKAVILAAGRGTRMQRSADLAAIPPAARDAVRAGLKCMIPIHGRPYMDYVIQSLLDAGLRRVCLVVSPVRSALHDRYERMAERMAPGAMTFAVQPEPLGTASALLPAKQFAAGEDFIMVNGDNLYPVEALRSLARTSPPALAAFTPAGLAHGNISAERIAAFATLDIDADGRLRRIIEKPVGLTPHAAIRVSMNCWHFSADIFAACRAIAPNAARGEYELPSAVQHGIDAMGMQFRAVDCDLPVLDLTSPADIESVERLLAGRTVSLPEVKP